MTNGIFYSKYFDMNFNSQMDYQMHLAKVQREEEMYCEISDAVNAGQYEETKKLLENGSDVNWHCGFGISLLMLAASDGNEKIVKLLLEYGADKSYEDMNGEKASDWAARKGHTEIINIIESSHVSKNAKIDEKTKRKGCFIATATYGDYNNPSVIEFRNFRDTILLNSLFGRLFINFYYRTSPYISKFISSSPILKKMSRITLEKLLKLIRKNYEV